MLQECSCMAEALGARKLSSSSCSPKEIHITRQQRLPEVASFSRLRPRSKMCVTRAHHNCDASDTMCASRSDGSALNLEGHTRFVPVSL
eukprot:1141315-Amphidinium_carterae.2